MIRLFLPVCGVLLVGVANAQVLPPPAPIVEPLPNVNDSGVPTPTPFVLENPPSNEEPIVIGEPVRAQKTPAPKPRPKPAAIPKKIDVAGVDVSGLNDAKAIAKLKLALSPQLQEPVKIVVGEYQYTFLRAELGAQIPYLTLLKEARSKGNAALRFQTDAKLLEKSLRELDTLVRADFRDTSLNVAGTRARIVVALERPPVATRVQTLTSRLQPATPRITESPTSAPDEIQKPSGTGKFPYLWASFTTKYDAGLRGRTSNLKMAAKFIDGSVVLPGKVFSTNLTIGPRRASAGWREAKMFVSGRVVSGTGSGICQAASTLYNAALLADFPIVERHAHSMRVTYVPPSQDASLLWGSKDFRFRNDTDTPLKVNMKVSGGRLSAWIWGQKPRSAPDVKVVSSIISKRRGVRSEAYKIVDGKKLRLSRDYYLPH